jgi:integral membrane sensor domain MASE1
VDYAAQGKRVEVVHRERSAVQILILVVLMSAVYAAGLYVTRGVVFIPGVTWFRPANMFSELYGVNFGPWGALACGIGNALNDAISGGFNLVTEVPIFPIEVIATGLIP